MLADSASINAAVPGSLEGYLKIVSLNEVEPAHEMPRQSVTAEVNTRYPLVILSRDGKKEIAGDRGRKWKLSHCTAARGLCSGRARVAAQARALEAATIRGCLESDCPRRYEY